MARYCLTGSRIAPTYRGLRPRVLCLRVRSQANPNALPPYGQWVQGQISLSTAFQADQHLSTNWSDMPAPRRGTAFQQVVFCCYLRFQRDKRKSCIKWQPAFRLVKVVFVVVNRQHRVHNQTVVPVVSVVVKTEAQKR